jgi:hypothetical protein
LLHQLLKHNGFVALSRGKQEGHRLAVAITTQVNLGAKAPFAVPQCFAIGITLGCSCGMLMGTNHTAIDNMELSVKPSRCVCLLLQTLQNLLPDSPFAPSIKAS